MEEISSADHVRKELVLQTVKEDWITLCTVNRRKVSWIGPILPMSYILKHVSEGKRGKCRSDWETRKRT